jgi:hypothetical protein
VDDPLDDAFQARSDGLEGERHEQRQPDRRERTRPAGQQSRGQRRDE